jgi:hypothetical protein
LSTTTQTENTADTVFKQFGEQYWNDLKKRAAEEAEISADARRLSKGIQDALERAR